MTTATNSDLFEMYGPIRWNGGRRPVPASTLVSCKTRDGCTTIKGEEVSACKWFWGHKNGPQDIVEFYYFARKDGWLVRPTNFKPPRTMGPYQLSRHADGSPPRYYRLLDRDENNQPIQRYPVHWAVSADGHLVCPNGKLLITAQMRDMWGRDNIRAAIALYLEL